MRQVLLAFIRHTRAMIGVYLPEHHQAFFKPSKAAKLRCKAIAYTNHFACIVSILVLSPAYAGYITRMLVAYRHTFTRQTRLAWSNGELQLRGARISFRGAVPEDRCEEPSGDGPVPVHSKDSISEDFTDQQAVALPPSAEGPIELLLSCPKCRRARNAAKVKLLVGSAWRPLLCGVCVGFCICS